MESIQATKQRFGIIGNDTTEVNEVHPLVYTHNLVLIPRIPLSITLFTYTGLSPSMAPLSKGF